MADDRLPNARLAGAAGNAYAHCVNAASSLRSPFLLLVRLYWGWQFAQSGWGKLHRLPQVTQYFQSLNVPFPGLNAPFIAGLEFVGGILLILGLASRAIGLLLACDMVVAYLAADRDALHAVFSDPGKFYNADPYTFLFAGLLIFIFGPGRFAIDTIIAAIRTRRARQTADVHHARETV